MDVAFLGLEIRFEFGAGAGFLMFATVMFCLVGLGIVALRRGSFGRRLIAMRDKSNQAGSGNYGFLVPAEGNSGASNVSARVPAPSSNAVTVSGSA